MKKTRFEEEEKKWKDIESKEREEFLKENSKSENPKEKEKSG
jgi:hypothetical protein